MSHTLRNQILFLAPELAAVAVVANTTGTTQLIAGGAGVALVLAALVVLYAGSRDALAVARSTRRADRRMVEERHWQGALAGLAYVNAILYGLPDGPYRRLLSDTYQTVIADPAVQDVERRAVRLLTAHRVWEPARSDLHQLATWSGAAAQAATAALAAPWLGPADVDRLAGVWRQAGLPLLSGGGLDPTGRQMCAPVPVGAYSPRIPASAITNLARMLIDLASLSERELEQLPGEHQRYVRGVADFGPVHWRAEQTARRTGRWAAVGMDVYAQHPQAMRDAALAELVRDLISETEYNILSHTWYTPAHRWGQHDDQQGQGQPDGQPSDA